MTLAKYHKENIALPALLKYYEEKAPSVSDNSIELLTEFNEENNIPQKFLAYVQEMYHYVSTTD